MTALQLLLAFLATSAGLMLLGLSYLTQSRLSRQGTWAFIVLMVFLSIWSLTYALELVATTPEALIAAHKLKYVAVVSVPVAWLLFAINYASPLRIEQWMRIAALFMVPLVSLILVFTTEQHNLFYESLATEVGPLGFTTVSVQYGTWFVLHALYSYGLILVGGYYLVQASIRTVGTQERVLPQILLAVAIPSIGSILNVFDVSPLPNVDLTPMLFAVSGVLLTQVLHDARKTQPNAISYNTIVHHLPNPIMVIGLDNHILTVNQGLEKLLHIERSSLVGEPIQDVLPTLEPIVTRLPQEHSLQESLELAGRYIDLVATPMETAHTETIGYVLSFQDNTIRKQTEIALYANERRYKALFDNSNDAIFLLDLDFTVVIANEQAGKLLGIDRAILLMKDLKDYIWPTERSDAEQLYQQVIAGEQIPLFERTFLRSTGEAIFTEVNIGLVRDSGGEPYHIQLIVRDITKRKQIEADLTERISQMTALRFLDDEANSTLNIDDVLDHALDAAVALSQASAGFIAVADEKGMTIERVAGAYDTSYIGQALSYEKGIIGRVLRTQQAAFVIDVAQDDDYCTDLPDTQAVIVLPLRSQERLVGLVNLETNNPANFTEDSYQFIQILTSRLAAAVENAQLYRYVREQLEELRQLYEEQRQMENLKTDMIRIANHDLKNPLSIIEGYLSLLELDRDDFSDMHWSYFEAIGTSVKRMFTILDDFLSVERINQRAQNAEIMTIDLRETAERVVAEQVSQAALKSQTIHKHLPDSGEALIRGDEPQLYEAITNLVGNAIKYTPDGGTITVSLDVDTDVVTFKVKDTGYGIPEDRQARLFEPFYRTKTAETAGINGTGLGLHLVKNIVKRHKGDVLFHSVYQQGSTFGFYLPCAPTERD